MNKAKHFENTVQSSPVVRPAQPPCGEQPPADKENEHDNENDDEEYLEWWEIDDDEVTTYAMHTKGLNAVGDRRRISQEEPDCSDGRGDKRPRGQDLHPPDRRNLKRQGLRQPEEPTAKQNR